MLAQIAVYEQYNISETELAVCAGRVASATQLPDVDD